MDIYNDILHKVWGGQWLHGLFCPHWLLLGSNWFYYGRVHTFLKLLEIPLKYTFSLNLIDTTNVGWNLFESPWIYVFGYWFFGYCLLGDFFFLVYWSYRPSAAYVIWLFEFSENLKDTILLTTVVNKTYSIVPVLLLEIIYSIFLVNKVC